MIIDCISDLHGEFPELEGGDLLIVAGDFADNSTYVKDFLQWLPTQKYKKIIAIAGNHDNLLYVPNMEIFYFPYKEDPIRFPFKYLRDSGTEFNDLKIWGSPWTKTFEGINPHCTAFTVDTDEELAEKWALIPDDIDILVTHCPPYDILDQPKRGEHVGSDSLFRALFRIKPKLHVFGHIHECGGQKLQVGPTLCVNASLMDGDYKFVHKPVRIEL